MKKSPDNSKKTIPKTSRGQVRIIAGKWRSRKLTFPAVDGLRPTPNRVRETLFNWLAPRLPGARCLDLFAGSGALGFEALSRGARSVVMIEQAAPAVMNLRANAKLLQTTDAEILCQQVTSSISELQNRQFDIVFLDPPFHQGWILRCCQLLVASRCLAESALVYIEAESELQPLPVPADWKIVRNQKAGQVGYYLVQTSC